MAQTSLIEEKTITLECGDESKLERKDSPREAHKRAVEYGGSKSIQDLYISKGLEQYSQDVLEKLPYWVQELFLIIGKEKSSPTRCKGKRRSRR